MKKIFTVLMSLFVATSVMAGCENGSMEHAGKKVDQAARDVKYKVKDVTTPDNSAERAGQKVDQAAEEATQ